MRTLLPTSLLGLLLTTSVAWAQPATQPFQPKLLKAEFTSRHVRPGDPVAVTLKFRNEGRERTSTDYRVFFHLEQPKGCEHLRVNADHDPTEPTRSWQPGQTVVDGPRTIILPDDLPEGQYHVHVGLFDYQGGGGRVLDIFEGTIQVDKNAPSATEAAPPRLAPETIAQRRQQLAARIAPADRVTLEHGSWRFDLDRRCGVWSLLDQSTEVLWTSSPALPRFGRITLTDGKQTCVWPVDRFTRVEALESLLLLSVQPEFEGRPTGTTVTFTLQPDAATGGLNISYQAQQNGPWKVSQVRLLENALPVTAEDDGHYYLPYRLGIELAATDAFPGSRGWKTYNNLSMAMCGLVKEGSALLIDWNQVDTTLTTQGTWHDLPLLAGRQALSLSLDIEGPRGACTLLPLGSGSYVEIAKAYRRCAEAKGWRKTWAEKRKAFPTVDRIFGAADFKPFVFSRVLPSSRFNTSGKERTHLGFTFDEAARCAEHWRNDLAIDRAYVVLAGWIEGGYDVRHPDVLPAAAECGGNEALIDAAQRIRDCGYLFGLHDNYQDMYEDAPSFGQQWLNKNAKGEPKMGGNWNGGQAWQVCAIKQVELASRPETNLPKIAQLFGPTIYFIDTVFAWPLVTCEDPQHPMTRHDDLVWKSKLCMLAKKYFGLFGSEEGREWAVPCADYLEGIFGHQTDSKPGEVIPLLPIVYSDCVQIMTHQGNRIGPGDEKKVADHILFAEMFLPRFGSHLYWKTDQVTVRSTSRPQATALWAQGDDGWGRDLCETDRVIKNVWEVLSPLNVITAERPLDDHQFLTPDRLLQRTRFGDLTITVAYEKPAEFDDHAVPAYGFVIDSPTFIAFCATRYAGLDYTTPTLFTARSLDGRPLSESVKIRIYHGFGDSRIRIGDKEFVVEREEVVSAK